jgi:hypothetical protein
MQQETSPNQRRSTSPLHVCVKATHTGEDAEKTLSDVARQGRRKIFLFYYLQVVGCHRGRWI